MSFISVPPGDAIVAYLPVNPREPAHISGHVLVEDLRSALIYEGQQQVVEVVFDLNGTPRSIRRVYAEREIVTPT